MRFYIVCPEKLVSGGPELAHQLCYEINKNGQYATMYYADKRNKEKPIDADTPEKFKKYCNDHVTDISEVDEIGNVVVIPEGFTDWAFYFEKAMVCIWWMSVDNFPHLGNEDYIRALDGRTSFHLVQSYYAADYLRRQAIDEDKLIWLSDYIGDAYQQFIFPAQHRENRILFNPKKGLEEITPLIKMCSFVEWVPLVNMTEEEMVLNMQLSKLYIDFGKHPGKDRIPREAAACGCLVLTNRKGSAAFSEDVPIDEMYKFAEPLEYEKITAQIKEMLENYEIHFERFEEYRKMIKSEKFFFEEDSRGFIDIMLKKCDK